MSRMTDRKERFNSFNDLTGLAQCLVDRNILIDLRNETSVAGKITNVDGFMNISMENVVYIDELGKHFRMDEFMIYPRYIRYIHIPDEKHKPTNVYSDNLAKLFQEIEFKECRTRFDTAAII